MVSMSFAPDPSAASANTRSIGPSELDLLTAQVRAIDAWHRSNRLAADAAEVIGVTREMRLDLSNRMEARRRQQAALIARVDQQLRATGEQLCARRPVRAVLAHRSEWLASKVRSRLEQRGVLVVGVFSDGAEAAGTIVAEQPELVFLEDRLPSLTGSDLVRQVRHFSPLSVIGAQVADSRAVAVLVDLGAHAVFTRRIPPVEVADHLLARLTGDQQPVVLR
jgi:CheY-like chemotaxis protein